MDIPDFTGMHYSKAEEFFMTYYPNLVIRKTTYKAAFKKNYININDKTDERIVRQKLLPDNQLELTVSYFPIYNI